MRLITREYGIAIQFRPACYTELTSHYEKAQYIGTCLPVTTFT